LNKIRKWIQCDATSRFERLICATSEAFELNGADEQGIVEYSREHIPQHQVVG